MRTHMRDKKPSGANALTVCGLLTALAMIFSYIEAMLTSFLPLPMPPGVKLGLANTVVTLAFFGISPKYAFMISVGRVLLSALLFGNATSLVYSALGALFAFAGLALSARLGERISFVGASIFSAVLHSIGQICASICFFGAAPIYYLPTLIIASIVFGSVTGALMNYIIRHYMKGSDIRGGRS